MMTEQEEFFSPNHKRLLDIATWAKYLAWIVLIVYILNAILQVIQQKFPLNDSSLLQNNQLLEGLEFNMRVVTTVLRGVIFSIVLKGISLGLNMIVETDINYREQIKEEGAQ